MASEPKSPRPPLSASPRPSFHPDAEWLEADGLGGFASGTVSGIRTRRYHALLLVARNPPTDRVVLVNGIEAWVETPNGTFALSSQRYAPDVVHPDGASRIVSFTADPCPQWTYRLEDGTEIEQRVFALSEHSGTALSWRLNAPREGVVLVVRPLLSGRDYHHLHRENSDFCFDAEYSDRWVTWRPYPNMPAVSALSSGEYTHDPLWYRNFLYAAEQERGLDAFEDLASPGFFRIPLTDGSGAMALCAVHGPDYRSLVNFDDPNGASILSSVLWSGSENDDPAPSARLQCAIDAYIVRRGNGGTILAGYPWFTDWGRDTFIAIRGLCLATGRLKTARKILLAWAAVVSEGMLPNRFSDSGDVPEYNSVDASLWYVIAVHEFLALAHQSNSRLSLSARDERTLRTAVAAILDGYASGTRYGIRLDGDGLLAAGEPGQQLTWMDVKIGDWVVTPRTGKPVEIQALWLNALHGAEDFETWWRPVYELGLDAFERRFWNAERGCLYDVVDVDHVPETEDGTLRPNQILAVGGLPVSLMNGDRARQIVDAVEQHLWTPLGLRSLAPTEPGYCGHYTGGVRERDAAYHQGTVWPWLAGPFIEAWVRVRGNTDDAKQEARTRFLAPLLQHLDEAGLGHISEIADGDPPHTPRGCPFQAWSLAEALRLDLIVL